MTDKSRKKYKPLRSFSWSSNPDKTTDQVLIESTVKEWYDAKHRAASKEENDFINSIKIEFCPYCGSTSIVKNGHTKSGIQRYRCNECKSRFTPLTNTIFDSRKIPISEWIEYLLHLFEFHSISSTAYDNRNASSTGKYWLYKVFSVLENIQDEVVLNGIIYLDETYLTKINREIETKNGKKLRGISRNKIGVGVACNGDKSIFIATGTSKPSKASTLRTYEPHIESGSTIIHDDENTHEVLVRTLELNSIVHPTSETKGLPDEENPLNKVNELHRLLKTFMKSHGGYDRENMQEWLNLFWFIMNDPKDRYDKVLKFVKIAILSPQKSEI